MKVYKLILLLSLVLFYCSSETTKSDIYVKPNFPLSKANKIIIGYFSVRTNVPYIKLNFQEQLEYHLLKLKFNIISRDNLLEFYKEKKIKYNRPLTNKEIKESSGEISFDLFIQGILYEEDRSLYEGGNHIIVHLNLYSPSGEKISTIRYIYTGDRSLISGELIDEAINKLLNELNSHR
ncbi:MAG: hypothetical protein OEV44_03640 [Spirochaetota bacterium]|nr:hypothetical protein [Spirochaetota bacterium]